MESVVNIKAINGVKVRMLVKDPIEHQQRCWVSGKFYEAQKNGLLSYLYRNRERYAGGECLDIGASIGNHSIYFAKVLGCRVTAFEPVESSYNHFCENCYLNKIKVGEIAPLHIALGEKQGKVSMLNVSGETFNVGMYQVIDGNDTTMDTLDSFFDISSNLSFIKIDVEHYNEPLLRGAENTLRRQKDCHVFIECETDEILSVTDEIMTEYGYKRDQELKLNHTPTYLWVKSE